MPRALQRLVVISLELTLFSACRSLRRRLVTTWRGRGSVIRCHHCALHANGSAGQRTGGCSRVVPTLAGRIQTRIFVLAVIGSLLTLIVTPLLPLPTPVGRAYAITFSILAAVLIFGIAWEFIYHALQQFRWEKDW